MVDPLAKNIGVVAQSGTVSIQTLNVSIAEGQEAIADYDQIAPVCQWTDNILCYQGIPDFPAFESHRDELLPPQEMELF